MTTVTCGITQLNKINTTSRANDPLHDNGPGLLHQPIMTLGSQWNGTPPSPEYAPS